MRVLKHVARMAMLGLILQLVPACKTTPPQAKFATPDEAALTVQHAFKAQDLGKIQAIFGREGIEAVASGDPVSDRRDREVIALAMAQSWTWVPHGAAGKELVIGDEHWPFPIPLVRTGNEWRFDSAAGREEVLARRIGGNELGVIQICRDYVQAQKEYASQPHDGKPAGLFAQRFRSSPGRQDGLFWGRKQWDKSSPLNDLVTAAVAEGYDPNKPDASPFRGYRFCILTAQGSAAPGGQKSYGVNGDMPGGFALLAYPAKYASSGVMTFVVGPDGVVYQKDLGKDTTAKASRLVEYDPDVTWKAVKE